jgi:hypothetical protein
MFSLLSGFLVKFSTTLSKLKLKNERRSHDEARLDAEDEEEDLKWMDGRLEECWGTASRALSEPACKEHTVAKQRF